MADQEKEQLDAVLERLKKFGLTSKWIKDLSVDHLEELATKFEKAAEAHLNAIAKADENSNKAIDKLKAEHEKTLGELKAGHEKELTEANSKLEEALSVPESEDIVARRKAKQENEQFRLNVKNKVNELLALVK